MRKGVSDEGRKIILSMLEENPKARFLDLGCSIGDFTIEIAKKIRTSKIFGVDETEYINSRIPIYIADLNKGVPFGDEEFDIVVASQVIEHLWKPQVFLREIYRVLKPTGNAIISTPNLAAWHNVLYLILGKQPEPAKVSDEMYPEHEKPGHLRIFTKSELLKLLEFHGFRIEKVVGSGYILGRPSTITVKVRK